MLLESRVTRLLGTGAGHPQRGPPYLALPDWESRLNTAQTQHQTYSLSLLSRGTFLGLWKTRSRNNVGKGKSPETRPRIRPFKDR